MNHCGFCGRENEDGCRFCIDCGKPLVQGGARVIAVPAILKPPGAQAVRASSSEPARAPNGIPATRVSAAAVPNRGAAPGCPGCGAAADTSLPFCPHCGARTDGTMARSAGAANFTALGTATGPRIALLDEAGEVKRSFTIDGAGATLGRDEGDIRFPEDVFLSPRHAQVALHDGQLVVRDVGSRNGTWLYTDGPYRLQDGDTILIGSQLIRFRRLGYPGPHPPEPDQTRRFGSFTPSADIAMLAQLRADGSARDTLHLSPDRVIRIGRDQGDWTFPYDQTMSGKHAEVRSEDHEFILLDDGSRNGIAVAVRGEQPVKAGQRFLIGDQTLRLESV